MSENEKELTEEQLDEVAGGRKTAQGELGANKNPQTRPTGSTGGGIFTGGGGISTDIGEELDPPYHQQG